MAAALEVKGLKKSFGDVTVLRGVDFTLAKGEGAVLLGANGCGKSTMLRCLNRLTSFESGTVRVHGTDVSTLAGAKLKIVRRELGYVFQQFNLIGNVSVFQNVLFGALGRPGGGLINSLSAFAPQAERDRAMHCLERVGLADKAPFRAHALSGGQQQRVAIARMLMQSPTIVIADEPIASLDPKAGREVLELLFRIVSEERLTVLCTLHQLDLAREFGRRIIGMKDGRVVIDAATDSIHISELEGLYRADGATSAASASRHAAE